MTSSEDFRRQWGGTGRRGDFATWSPDVEPQLPAPQPAEGFTLPPIGPERSAAQGDPNDQDGRPAQQSDELEAAYARGITEGHRQGADEERERLKAPLAALEGLVQSFDAARGELLHDQERNLYGLAVALARHLVQREISMDPSVVRDLVQDALKLLPRETAIEVRMNPKDLLFTRDRLPSSRAGDSLQIHWIDDKALERGSFLMEAPNRVIDGRTDVALRRLYEHLSYE